MEVDYCKNGCINALQDMHTSFHVVPLLDDSVDEDVAVPGRGRLHTLAEQQLNYNITFNM